MKIAAVQLDAEFADVEYNLKKSEKLIIQAVNSGAELILLPEFFTSAIGFSEKMLDVAAENNSVMKWMKELSAFYNVIIGGSYIIKKGKDAYNSFNLVFPNGEVFEHKKDIPTQFENCYYTRGDENNVLVTPAGNFGVALCWEMLRYDTLKRITGKADIVLSCSCWWDLPEDASPEKEPLRKYNRELALKTPVVFAKLSGLPVIHASHCGKVTAINFPYSDKLKTRQYVGAAQISDGGGNVITRREFIKGEGFVICDVPLNPAARIPEKDFPSEYWIEALPDSYISAWNTINPKGKAYYESVALPYYNKQKEQAE